ncbi:MAG TPA: hypothetical protein VF039_13495 [Longimicrobiales bacterium]
MNCSSARDALLDAELDELRGRGDTPLAEHVRTCDACRADADRILAATAALGRALDTDVAARSSRAERARGGARDARNAGRRQGARPLRFVVPLVAAAAAAAALLVAAPRIARQAQVAPYTPPPRVPSAPVVNATGDGGVAVMNTADPTITVVWSY